MYGAVAGLDQEGAPRPEIRRRLDRAKMVDLTNCTFDGHIYNTRRVMEECLAIKPDLVFLWDEAWFGFAAGRLSCGPAPRWRGRGHREMDRRPASVEALRAASRRNSAEPSAETLSRRASSPIRARSACACTDQFDPQVDVGVCAASRIHGAREGHRLQHSRGAVPRGWSSPTPRPQPTNSSSPASTWHGGRWSLRATGSSRTPSRSRWTSGVRSTRIR